MYINLFYNVKPLHVKETISIQGFVATELGLKANGSTKETKQLTSSSVILNELLM